MKAQCDRCKEIVPLSFTAADGGIDVTCPSCKGTYFVAARAPEAAVATAVEPHAPVVKLGPTMACPKCGETQPPAPSCRRCGLVADKWRGAVASADASTPSLEDAREAAALWAAVEARWDDAARHDAFLSFCQKTTSYAFAATKYKGAQAAHPDAATRLKLVRALAEFALKRQETPRAPRTPYKATLMVVVGIFVLLLAGATALLFLRGKAAEKRRASPDAPVPTMKTDPPR